MNQRAAPATDSPPLNDCWNRIGVHGDGSCPELAVYAHCRNCPVYAAAAVSLLDRATPADYAAEWTRHFAEPAESEAGDAHSAVVFRLGTEWFALATSSIDEIAENRPIHPLPHQRNAALLGLVNVRGELVICISLTKMMGIGDATAATPGTRAMPPRLIVIRHETGRIAFPVAEVQRTHRYQDRDLKAVPTTIAKAGSNYARAILRWRDLIVAVLDADRLVQAVNRGLT